MKTFGGVVRRHRLRENPAATNRRQRAVATGGAKRWQQQTNSRRKAAPRCASSTSAEWGLVMADVDLGCSA